jgi:Beta-lactamase enzyme family
MALPAPIVLGGSTASFVPGGSLQRELTDRLAASRFKGAFLHMGIALADLTGVGEDPDPSRPAAVPLASNALFDNELAVGSLSKIAAMFAAFRLRERVIAASAAVGNTATSGADVPGKIMAEWAPLVTGRIAKPPHDSPNLSRMFDFASASPWRPDFKNAGKGWGDLSPLHESSKATIDTLKSMKRSKLMIRFSDNMAAGSCVRDVGFQYMNASLAAEGFADNARNGILWLGGDFGYAAMPGIMGAPPWDSGANATWVRANARGIISFLTLMWKNQLVDQASCKQMREIMLERGGVGFATNISNATPGQVRAFSKVGIIGTVSEGVIIEANSSGRLLRYAAAGLASTTDAALQALATIFLDTIGAVH